MVHVTLIGEKLAKVGNVFVYLGPLMECKDCRYKMGCMNLKAGQMYVIKALRHVKHNCKMHEGGIVQAVEVEPVAVPVVVETKGAVEGSTVVFELKDCGNLACAHYQECHPVGIKDGTRLKVVRVKEAVKCPMGYQVTLTEAEVL